MLMIHEQAPSVNSIARLFLYSGYFNEPINLKTRDSSRSKWRKLPFVTVTYVGSFTHGQTG